ncbi:MAG: PorV/PorQ family protein [Gemmatimonas sp.]
MATVLLLGMAGTEAAAQNGGLFLLVPFGARAVGQGEAVVADTTLGTEGMWWNAAALARLTKKEVAIHQSQTVIATSDMLTFAFPSKVLGTLAASAFLVNYGDQQATDAQTGTPIGTITNRNYQLALSYATPVGARFNAGLTYKFVMLRFQCSGVCGAIPIISGSTSALDLGAQYVLPTRLPVTVAASVRNLGPALQVRDAEQADPLPRVIQVGARVRVPIKALERSKATLDATTDLISAPALGGGAGGIGVALGYREQAFVRAGYKVQQGQGSGPSVGLGFQRGGFGVDIARRFDALSAQLGEPPTYVSIRARF